MVALWLAATVAAGLLVTLGVDAVADDVADPTPAAVAPTDATVGTTTSTTAGTTTTAAPAGPGTSTTRVTAPPSPSTTTPTAAPAPAPTTSTTVAPDPGEVKTFNGEGGSVSIRFRSTSVELVVATPSAGYRVEVEDSGPARVRVRFRSDDHETRIEARAGSTTATVSENG
jgi:hypothetical protein